MTKEKKVTQEDLENNFVPLHVRDRCAGVLIPLNKCRRENLYMTWACHDEKHSYEICMYKEFERRRAFKEGKK